MTGVVFVHGTGVREPGYGESLQKVTTELTALRPDVTLVPCYWGGEFGTRLHQHGESVPTYDSTRAIAGAPPADDDEDVEVLLWRLLYEDPGYELRLLALAAQNDGELAPGQESPGVTLDRAVRRLSYDAASPDLQAKLKRAGLDRVFESARDEIVALDAYQDALKTVPTVVDEYCGAVARAIVAEAVLEQSAAAGVALPLDGVLRDAIALDLAKSLGSYRAFGGWVAKKLFALAQKLGAMDQLQRRRRTVSDSVFPFTGDLMLYQARGDGIRSAIRESIKKAAQEATPPVVVLGHSLGGIAAVDLLVLEQIPEVTQLITVGSQSPVLYELYALVSRRYGEPLPSHFPSWLNIYDLRDFLSYVGAPIFPGRVEDVEVDSKQPFPQSHSAYWAVPAVWQAIVKGLP